MLNRSWKLEPGPSTTFEVGVSQVEHFDASPLLPLRLLLAFLAAPIGAPPPPGITKMSGKRAARSPSPASSTINDADARLFINSIISRDSLHGTNVLRYPTAENSMSIADISLYAVYGKYTFSPIPQGAFANIMRTHKGHGGPCKGGCGCLSDGHLCLKMISLDVTLSTYERLVRSLHALDTLDRSFAVDMDQTAKDMLQDVLLLQKNTTPAALTERKKKRRREEQSDSDARDSPIPDSAGRAGPSGEGSSGSDAALALLRPSELPYTFAEFEGVMKVLRLAMGRCGEDLQSIERAHSLVRRSYAALGVNHDPMPGRAIAFFELVARKPSLVKQLLREEKQKEAGTW